MAGEFFNNLKEREKYLEENPDVNPDEVFVRSGYTGKDFAGYLAYETEERGWNRRELMRQLEKRGTPIPYTTLIGYFNGETMPKADNFVAIANAFDHEMSELLYYTIRKWWFAPVKAERPRQKSVRIVPEWIAPGMHKDIDVVSKAINQRIDSLRMSNREIVPGEIINTFSSYVNWLIQKDMAEAVKNGEVSWNTLSKESENDDKKEIEDLKRQLAAAREQLQFVSLLHGEDDAKKH